MTSSNLPSLTFRDADPRRDEPQSLADSALYEGILSRRVGAYFVDAILIVGITLVFDALLVLLGLLTFGCRGCCWARPA